MRLPFVYTYIYIYIYTYVYIDIVTLEEGTNLGGSRCDQMNFVVLCVHSLRTWVFRNVMAALFNAPVDRKTFRAAMKRHRSSHGNQHWEDHGYSYVPWLDLHTAATLLRLNQTDEAIVHLQRAAQCTTTLGAFPEGIRPDGVYWKTWYATVHGAFTHAMNILLARRDDKHVYVMHGVPKHWGDIAYKNLRVPIGLVINASRVGQHHQIKIKNEHKASQHFWLWVGGDQKQPLAKEQIALEPHQQIHLEL